MDSSCSGSRVYKPHSRRDVESEKVEKVIRARVLSS